MEILPWKIAASSPSPIGRESTASLSSSHVLCFRRCSKNLLLPSHRRFPPAGVRWNGRQFFREPSVGKEFSDAEDFDDEDEDDDYDEAAEEYVIDEAQEILEEEDGSRVAEEDIVRRERFEEHKRQRVARLLADVREFGEGIIDYNELAGIYDFPLDKFQVIYFAL